MKCVRWFASFGLCLAFNAQAGHGLMNSFAGIEWLPPAGTTPADLTYRIERLLETTELAFADTPEARQALVLDFARERLAEIETLVKANDAKTAAPAITAYAAHLEQALAIVNDLEEAARPAHYLALATSLLEHQYIVSTDYLDLPRGSRTVLAEVMHSAAQHYAATRARLSRRTQDSLFFKEEEVRWSWEQAQGADAQGL